MIDLSSLQQFFTDTPLDPWVRMLPEQLDPIFAQGHGDLERWQGALAALPEMQEIRVSLEQECGIDGATDEAALHSALKALMPWRKGPFRFSQTLIDTEWHSDWKWARVASHIDLAYKNVLDVGCGNGYYGLRMLGHGAKSVIGIDPNWLFLHQFNAFKHYAPHLPIWQLPLTLEALTPALDFFDVTFSMGVLYHRRAPLEHLVELKNTLNAKGTLVLETLVVEGDATTALMPIDRYAQMRNVWYLPSVPALILWLARVGFKNIRCVDLSVTSTLEQRSTAWMTYQSLQDFLDPKDSSKTIEGYPAPMRAVILADK